MIEDGRGGEEILSEIKGVGVICGLELRDLVGYRKEVGGLEIGVKEL